MFTPSVMFGHGLRIFGLLLMAVSLARADFISSTALNGIAYFGNSSPAAVERYDLVSRAWLPRITLPGVRGTATAITVDAQGLYVAFGKSVFRYALDGSSETFLVNESQEVNQIVANATHLYLNHASPVFTSISKATNLIAEVKSYDFWLSSMHNLAMAPDGRSFFAWTANTSPADLQRISLGADGSLGAALESPYHGDYPEGSKVWVFPDGSRVLDSVGSIYRASDLVYQTSLTTRVTDLQFLGGGAIILRNNLLHQYGSDLLPSKIRSLEFTPRYIHLDATDILTFTVDATQPAQLRADTIPLSSLAAPQAGPAVDPVGLSFAPTDMFVDPDGILYLLASAQQNLIRWDSRTQKYLPSIPLLGSPDALAYSSYSHRVYLAYPDGVIRYIHLGIESSSWSETFFTTILRPLEVDPMQNTPPKLLAVGQYLYLQTYRGLHETFDGSGNRISSVKSYTLGPAVWNPTTQKVYTRRNANDVYAEQVNESGTAYAGVPAGGLGTEQSVFFSSADNTLIPFVRLSPDGSALLLGDGKIIRTTALTQLAKLANTVADATWMDGAIYSVRDFAGLTQLQRWNGTNYTLVKSKQVTGSARRLFKLPTSRLLAVTSLIGKPAFDLLTDALDLVPPYVWEAPARFSGQVTAARTITLKWEDGSGETHYLLERRNLPSGEWETLPNASGSLTYADMNVPAGGSFEYRLRAVNGTTFSAESVVQVSLAVPPAPASLGATQTAPDGIRLDWSAVPEALSYKLESRGSDGVWRPLVSGLTATTYQAQKLAVGAEHAYRVLAVNGVGSSSPSPVASVSLELILPLQPTWSSDSAYYWEIRLFWKSGDYAAKWVVERRPDEASPWQVLAEPTTNSYIDTSVLPQATYQYRLRGTNALGYSPYSEIRTVTVPAISRPYSPTGLMARPESATSVRLTWTDGSGETGYKIERCTEDWVSAGTTGANETTFIDTGLVTGKLYFYRVFAVNSAGTSSASGTDSATPLDVVVWMEDNFNQGLKAMWSSVSGGITVDGGTGFLGSPALWFGRAGTREAMTIPMDASQGGVLEYTIRAGYAWRDGAEYWDNSEQGDTISLEYLVPNGNWTSLTQISGQDTYDWSSKRLKIPAAAWSKSTRFRWRQSAHDGAGKDSWALEDVRFTGVLPEIPAAPAMFGGQATGPTTASFSWSASTEATGYLVQRLDADQWVTVNTVNSDTTATMEAGLLANHLYYFRVLATNPAGHSTSSPLVSIQTWGGGGVNDGTVGFLSPEMSVRETPTGSTVTLTVARTGSNAAPATVDYSFLTESAKAGLDFTAQSGTLTFAPGETTATISVSLLADTIVEPDETFLVNLDNALGAQLGEHFRLRVTIQDDDSVGRLAFATSAATIDEAIGQAILTVRRTEGSHGAVSVNYALVGGTAQTADYVFTPGTLEFADGEVEKTLSIAPVNDSVSENLETIVVELSGVTGGATLGSLFRHTVSILDDDNYTSVAGSYAGLLTRAESTVPEGLLRIKTTKGGSISGVLAVGRTSRSFLGRLNAQGQVQLRVGVLPAGSTSDDRNLIITLNPAGDGFAASYADSTGAVFESTGVRLLSALETSSDLLNHTFTGVMRDESDGLAVKAVSSLLVSRFGSVSVRGYAPNTKTVLSSGYLTADGRMLVRSAVSGGMFFGELESSVNAGDGVSFAGALWWQPTALKGAEPADPTELWLKVDPYDKTQSVLTSYPLNEPSSQLAFDFSASGEFLETLPVKWSSKTLLSGAVGNRKVRLTLNLGSGYLLGTLTAPGEKTLRLFGVLMQPEDGGLPIAEGFANTGTQAREWIAGPPPPAVP